jgi:hypothetical protein
MGRDTSRFSAGPLASLKRLETVIGNLREGAERLRTRSRLHIRCFRPRLCTDRRVIAFIPAFPEGQAF